MQLIAFMLILNVKTSMGIHTIVFWANLTKSPEENVLNLKKYFDSLFHLNWFNQLIQIYELDRLFLFYQMLCVVPDSPSTIANFPSFINYNLTPRYNVLDFHTDYLQQVPSPSGMFEFNLR